jgi:AMMECR1 domain-containing protein
LAIAEDVAVNLDLSKVVSVATAHLYSLFGRGPAVAADILQGPAFARLNVTLRTRGAVRGSMSGGGETLRDQLLDAVYRSSRDNRFSGSLVKADLDQLTVEVWLQISSELIPIDERVSEQTIRLGLDGVEVELGSAFAYYKPSVALTSQFTSCGDMFSALCKKANLPLDAWKSSDCILRKTSWIHFCETPDREVIRMTALRSPDPVEITAESMAQWARSGAGYLMANQYSDGSFCYQYHPILNSTKKGDTNPVRASGCAYAIAEAASSPHLNSDREMKACADRAVAAILRRTIQLEHGGMYIADNQNSHVGGKLGTTALLLLALLTPELRVKYEQEVDDLLTGIKSAQLSSGLFECSFGSSVSSDSQINFFPGQAILALVVRAQLGDESCRQFYRKAFDPYRNHFRKSPATAFVGWQVDVWSRAALLDSNAEYADFVFEQIDWLLQFQIRNHMQTLDSGGFSWNGKQPNYSSIVYTEAIARAADLAYRVNDGRWVQYRDAFRLGLDFCSRLWMTREQSTFFPHPSRAIGGVATSISDFTVRSDFVQHAITLALAALERPVLLDTAASSGSHRPSFSAIEGPTEIPSLT